LKKIQQLAEITSSNQKKRAEAFVEKTTSGNQRVTMTAQYSTLFDSDSIIRADELRKSEILEKEALKKQKNEAIEEKRSEKRKRDEVKCRVKGCRCRFPESPGPWNFCEHCDKFGICRKHWKDIGEKLMHDHEVECGDDLDEDGSEGGDQNSMEVDSSSESESSKEPLRKKRKKRD
jgi:hypothetical protein